MRVVSAIAELRRAVAEAREQGRRVALVPTMGALHDGHLSLVRRARAEAGLVVMSVFVNPLQFAPGDDLTRYPRDLDGDAAKAREAGVDVLFTPAVEELYPHAPRVAIHPVALDARWEGAVRPGHFAGVLTVVLKLFNIVQPDVALFGQKDFQQVAIVRAMVEDLDLPLSVIVEPIVRERDGLAMSSRNRYLADSDRREAARLSRALDVARMAFDDGEREAAALQQAARAVLDAAPAIAVDYLAVVDAASLEPVARASSGDAVLLAARVGPTRLLDNIVLGAR